MTDAASLIVRNSTIVRAPFPPALTAMRLAFSTLDKVAPALGSRWAARVWLTLPAAGNARRRDDRPIPGLFAPPSTVDSISIGRGRESVAESWGEGPAVYLIHGWGGWRGQLGGFVEPLLSRGHQVVALDAPSHGESPPGEFGPNRSTIVEFADTLRAAADRYGPPAGIVGHSLGCAAAALAVTDGLDARRFAFVAPAGGWLERSHEMARALGFSDRTRLGMLRRLEQIVDRPMSDFDLLTMNDRHPMPPTLVLHDRSDREVPHQESERLASIWPGAEFVSTDGLGHQRILRDPSVIDRVAAFVTERT